MVSQGDAVVGTWNLEFLHQSRSRGFPELLDGGPIYGPRVDADYRAIADVIARGLDAVILVLNEVNSQPPTGSPSGSPVSAEIEHLRNYLGAHYAYVISQSGGSQHVAILWDQRRARLDTVFELTYPTILVQGKDVLPRDPLVARFTLLADGMDQNDLVIVGLHLASGKANHRNHDSALALLVDTLEALVHSTHEMLGGEMDVMLAGDFNFDLYDDHREAYVERMELGRWDVLANRDYLCTRLGGVPLQPDSRLDYVICTDAMRGSRALINRSMAQVHQDDAGYDFDRYRQIYSDHFPVSVRVRLAPDDD